MVLRLFHQPNPVPPITLVHDLPSSLTESTMVRPHEDGTKPTQAILIIQSLEMLTVRGFHKAIHCRIPGY